MCMVVVELSPSLGVVERIMVVVGISGGIVVTIGGVVWLLSMGIGHERGRWVSERVIFSAVATYLVMCVQLCTCKNTCSVVNS